MMHTCKVSVADTDVVAWRMVSLLEVQQLVSSLGQDHATNLVQNLETSKYVQLSPKHYVV